MNCLSPFFRAAAWVLLAVFSSTSMCPLALALDAPSREAAPSTTSSSLTPTSSWVPPAPVFSRGPRRIKEALPATEAHFNKRLSATPDTSELRKFSALDHPLLALPARGGPTASERARLARVLEKYVEKPSDRASTRLRILQAHLDEQPTSPFAGTLWLEISAVARRSANLMLALQAGREAWREAQLLEQKGEALKQAEHALGNLATLYARLGQRQALVELLDSIKARPSHPTSSDRVAQARAAVAWWDSDPDAAGMCGIMAYNTLASRLGSPLLHKPNYTPPPDRDKSGAGAPNQVWAMQKPVDRANELRELGARGLSAGQLLKRVQEVGADWRWVKRTSGTAIPSPAVVHFQFGTDTGHYSALLESREESTRVVDRYFLSGIHKA